MLQRDSQGGKVERLRHRPFGAAAIAACAVVFVLLLSARADAQSEPPSTSTTKPATSTTKPATSTTKPAASEDAPGAPAITAVSAGDKQAQVTWKASAKKGATEAVKYEITPYRGEVAQPPTTVDAPATTVTVTGLHNGAKYTFKIAAIDAQGHKSKDSIASRAVTLKAASSSAWYKRKRYWAAAFVVLAVLIGLGLFFFLRRGKKPGPEASDTPDTPDTPDAPGSPDNPPAAVPQTS